MAPDGSLLRPTHPPWWAARSRTGGCRADADEVGQPDHDAAAGPGGGLQPVLLDGPVDRRLAAARELRGVGPANPLLGVGGRGGGGAHGGGGPLPPPPPT